MRLFIFLYLSLLLFNQIDKDYSLILVFIDIKIISIHLNLNSFNFTFVASTRRQQGHFSGFADFLTAVERMAKMREKCCKKAVLTRPPPFLLIIRTFYIGPPVWSYQPDIQKVFRCDSHILNLKDTRPVLYSCLLSGHFISVRQWDPISRISRKSLDVILSYYLSKRYPDCPIFVLIIRTFYIGPISGISRRS